MLIRTKLLLGCLSLTLVAVVVGVLGQVAQARMGVIALQLYDDTFMSMSYLRSAQNNLVVVTRDLAAHASIDDARAKLKGAAEDLVVARMRASSPAAVASAERLLRDILALADVMAERQAPPPVAEIDRIAAAFDEAVEVFAGDGYRARRQATATAEQTSREVWAAIAVSLGVALAITAMLTRAIVPPLREAVRIAASIASGRLDNVIPAPRAGAVPCYEAGQLMHALGTMQASIADKIKRIERLMADQAVSHAVEIAVQNHRFEAALDNMSQGLCMFDAGGRLQVVNRRFGQMFGLQPDGAADHEVLPPILLHADQATPVRTLEDGRAIAVARRGMQNGGWVATFEDVTERQRVEARLVHMARHDTLTGLPNRVLYREHMEHALAHARRGGGLAVLCLDLDDFKSANEALGHAVGDALLRETAQRLLAVTREADLVVRLGGDEFAVVQSGANQPTDAKALADRLVAALAQPFDAADGAVTLSASIGIAVTTDGLTTADGLLKCADLALFRAKADGRGTYRFFEAEMDASMRARRALEQDLRRAVADEAFEVHYQPLVDAFTGAIAGFEGLVRWRHPVRGMVSPGEFIPVAEDVGLISAIGAWVLNRACQDAVLWPAHVKVAVNLSPLQFRNRNLPDEVAAALLRSGLPADRLELEITESLLLQDSESILAMLHEVRGLGVRISMDDFGTGYSSLSYLRRFPFDKIKIDQSFIRNMDEKGDCLAIVRAVVGLGASLGMRVTAEGVETEEQYALLRREGCHQLQGYLFSRPVPCSAVPSLITRIAEAA